MGTKETWRSRRAGGYFSSFSVGSAGVFAGFFAGASASLAGESLGGSFGASFGRSLGGSLGVSFGVSLGSVDDGGSALDGGSLGRTAGGVSSPLPVAAGTGCFAGSCGRSIASGREFR